MGSIATGGRWQPHEGQQHINVLELCVAYFTLKSFLHDLVGKHVKILLANTCAVSILYEICTCHSNKCNEFAPRSGTWVRKIYSMWLTAAHIPGEQNVIADFESRHFNVDMVWMLNSNILTHGLRGMCFSQTIDLFASRLNKQFAQYVSYRPDLYSLHINASTISCTDKHF